MRWMFFISDDLSTLNLFIPFPVLSFVASAPLINFKIGMFFIIFRLPF